MRLFVAIDLPETIKKQIEKLCTGVPGVRWVRPDQMHLTLRFIGEANKDRVASALASVQFKPFEMALQGVGQFPPKRTPRVLWVGLTKPDTLVQLARDVEKTIVALGFPPEDKSFSPHITLARLKVPPAPAALQNFFEKNVSSEPFLVDEFVLYSSTLLPEGASYRREAVYAAKS